MSEQTPAEVRAAQAYLDALVSHDGSHVPLAPECWRIENGANTGASGPEIRRRLADPVMHIITGYRDVRFTVAGPDVFALYLLDTAETTVHVAERFRVVDAAIVEIEAVFHIEPTPRVRRWPDDPANAR